MAEVSGIDRETFISFCSKLLIPAKESNESGETLIPLVPMQTQLYLLDEILEGLSRGIHFFIVLKCRQSGITTLGLAFDLYWLFRHDGLIFHFIADNAKRTNYNRSLMRDFIKSLAKHPQWRQEVEDDNRELISFANRSKIIWNSANSRDEGGLGKGTGVMGVHATEVARFKDVEGMASLFSSLSQRNPNRFYLFEGTAEGTGIFRDMYRQAESDLNTSQKAIFIGWWLQPDYDLDLKKPEDYERYKTYYEPFPQPDHEEGVWVEAVKSRYGWDVTPTQLGWWRFHLKELKFDNIELMYQEYPPLPEYAWRYGANSFINPSKLMERRVFAENRREHPRYFQFQFGDSFHETQAIEVDPRAQWYDLVTWDEPKSGRGVRYVVSADPAHGASERGDHACVEILRCYADKCVQVGEFVRRELPTYKLAWVILHLAGTYNSETLLNVELNGGGYAVMDEIQRLQNQLTHGYDPALSKYFQNLQHYVYSRADAVRRAYGSYHWRTTPDTRERMLAHFRDFVERGLFEIRSLNLIEEAEGIERLSSGEIETPTHNHRLMAACVGIMGYIQVLETDLGGSGFTEEYFKHEQRGIDGLVTPNEFMTASILQWRDEVIRKDAEEQAAKKAPAWLKKMR